MVPEEYFQQSPYPGELPGGKSRGLYAVVHAQDDTGLFTGPIARSAVNYPDWDPLYPLHRSSNRPDNTIQVPLPLLFQPGVFGQVNGGSADQLQAFLSADAGFDANGAWRALKTERKIPSFLFFSMPSAPSAACAGFRSDGVPWGYDGCVLAIRDEVVSENAARLLSRIVSPASPLGVRTVIEGLSPGRSAEVPIHLVAHSFGGLVGRHFLKTFDRNTSQPIIGRFITLDTPHGGIGTTLGVVDGLLGRTFFSEPHLNGVFLSGSAVPEQPYWNDANRLEPSAAGRHLMISAEGSASWSLGSFINPDASALGVGRAMQWLSSPAGGGGVGLPGGVLIPTGHCGRFMSGWELTLPLLGNAHEHSIQNELSVMTTVATFLAYGTRPRLEHSGPAGSVDVLADQSLPGPTSAYPTCQTVGLAALQGVGELAFSMQAASGQTSDHAVEVDVAGILRVQALLNSVGAGLSVRDAQGVEIPPLQSSAVPGEGGVLFVGMELNVGPGTVSVRLSGSPSVPSSHAQVQVKLPGDLHARASTPQPAYTPGAAVFLDAGIFDGNGQEQLGAVLRAEVVVRAPDGTEWTSPVTFDDGTGVDAVAGDGLIRIACGPAALPGIHTFVATVGLQAGAAPMIFREVTGSFAVESGIDVLAYVGTRTVDGDQDGLTDAIALDYDLLLPAPGDYLLEASLTKQGQLVELITGQVAAGTTSIVRGTITIPARMFFLSGGGGPYVLENVRVIEPATSLVSAPAGPQRVIAPPPTTLEVPELPQLARLVPDHGPKRGGNEVVVLGRNFRGLSQVLVDGQPASFDVDADDALRITIPVRRRIGIAPNPGFGVEPEMRVDVTLVTPWGQTNVAGAYQFVPGG